MPEALAAQRGGAQEGLAWLGRAPEAKRALLRALELAPEGSPARGDIEQALAAIH